MESDKSGGARHKDFFHFHILWIFKFSCPLDDAFLSRSLCKGSKRFFTGTERLIYVFIPVGEREESSLKLRRCKVDLICQHLPEITGIERCVAFCRRGEIEDVISW